MTRSFPALPALAILVLALPAAAQEEDRSLAQYFGFEPMEILVIDDGFGPMAIGDLNGNGLNDLVIVNNRKSRLELWYQRAPRVGPEEPAEHEAAAYGPNRATQRVNEFQPHWRFRRENLSVSHRVTGLILHDFDGDGLLDIIYAGTPSELVMMAQTTPGVFEVVHRRPVRDLSAGRFGMVVADLIDDDEPELIVTVDTSIHLYPITPASLGRPTIIDVGERINAIHVEDFTGNGLNDLLAVIRENAVPVRLWVQSRADGVGRLGPENRFAMPALRNLAPVGRPEHPGTGIAVIERVSKRFILYHFVREHLSPGGSNEAPLTVQAFPSSVGTSPAVRVGDVTGNGHPDIVVTDTEANAILLYRNVPGKGFVGPDRYPTLAEPVALAGGWASSPSEDGLPARGGAGHTFDLFVLSRTDSVVGRSTFGPDGFAFPTPLPMSGDLVTLELVRLPDPTLAVISRERRQHTLTLHDLHTGEQKRIDLGTLPRSPETILAWDADQDGRTDLLILTPNEPMLMLHAQEEDGFKLLTRETMGQFGLVQAAAGDNTTLLDIDDNGNPELLIADRNYVRAVRYEPQPADGASPGWQVVEQFNLADAASRLASITILEGNIVVADRANRSLTTFERRGRTWVESGALRVTGFDLGPIHAMDQAILCTGSGGFAVVMLGGELWTLDELAAHRTDRDDRVHHAVIAGDVNADGLTDLILLDSGEQMLEIFTLSEAGRLHQALEFPIFQSKLFTRGESREFEPRSVYIADVTGSGADDILIVVHDRVLIYPQAVE